jgi:glutamine synthetase
MIVLNTIMADQLIQFKKDVDARINGGDAKDEAILKELQKLITHSKKIRFEGNGYGDEWVKEAESRGLNNFKDTPRALGVWSEKKTIEMFEKLNILTEREIEARKDIDFENYVHKIQIEARLIGELSQNQIIPAVIEYQNRLIQNVQGLNAVLGADAKAATKSQVEIITKISTHLNALKSLCDTMLEERKKVNKIENIEEKAVAYCDKVKVYFDEIRYHADKLELLVDDELWPLAKFREMLFTR